MCSLVTSKNVSWPRLILPTLIGIRSWAFQRTHYWTSKIQDGWDPPSWKSTWRHFFSAEGGPIWIKFRRLVQNDMSTAVIRGAFNKFWAWLSWAIFFGRKSAAGL